jgi:hypothetical protein
LYVKRQHVILFLNCSGICSGPVFFRKSLAMSGRFLLESPLQIRGAGQWL